MIIQEDRLSSLESNLKMNQCDFLKKNGNELYKPFLIENPIKREFASNIKVAKKWLKKKMKMWELIGNYKNHPVFLNRAPTLHRLSIQAFEPTLIEGKAIRLHPSKVLLLMQILMEDQMAVHLVLSRSTNGSKLLMLATNNIIAPSSGRPTASSINKTWQWDVII